MGFPGVHSSLILVLVASVTLLIHNSLSCGDMASVLKHTPDFLASRVKIAISE